MPQIGESAKLTSAPSPRNAAGWRATERGAWRGGGAASTGLRDLAEETPVAIVYDAASYAVMMASPLDLEDFAFGFSLTEGVIATLDEVEALEIFAGEEGIEARMWLRAGPRAALAGRRRRLAGPTGCGLCGIDSLGEATRPPARVNAGLTVTPTQIAAAMAAMSNAQDLGARTRAVHAAGFWTPKERLVALREDVGRHNALDKLAGALAREGQLGGEGAVLLTSRVSVEMVQKTAAIGAGVLIAVSAPTTLAVETAEAAGITLVAIARADGFEVFTHPHRVMG